MPFTLRQKQYFEVCYLMGVAQKLSEDPRMANWHHVGTALHDAEATACTGKVGGQGTAALPAACDALSKYIEKHTGGSVNTTEIGNMAIAIRDSAAERTAAGAGFWFGYVAGACRHSLRDGRDRKAEIAQQLKVAADNLIATDQSLTNEATTMQATVSVNAQPYAQLESMITSLVARLHP